MIRVHLSSFAVSPFASLQMKKVPPGFSTLTMRPCARGVLINLDDGTTLRIKPFLNKEGEPELLIGCVTEETVEEVYQRVSNYDFDEPCAGKVPS